MHDYKEIFPQRLNQVRLERGLTLKQLGEKVGVIMQTVGHWETGHARPNLLVFCRLADVLGCSLDFLVGRSDNP